MPGPWWGRPGRWDDPLAAGPSTTAETLDPVDLGVWNHVAMRWDGCELVVSLNGVAAPGVAYDPVPIAGLSYRGTGLDPTLGPLALPAGISTSGFPLVGKLDEVKLSAVRSCVPFIKESTGELIVAVLDLGLPGRLADRLVGTLERVLLILERFGPDPPPMGPDPPPMRAAVNMLGAFINAVEAQAGKSIPVDAAADLVDVAEGLIADLSAP